MSKGHYVCQRAAHAIIAEIGPLRVSSDALGAINLFLDEFLALLITSASSVDLVRLKTAVVQLLPHSLGKNALVEAEIELKHQVETEQHDFTSYEKMRILINQDGTFPVDQVIPLVQLACSNYCNLASDDNQGSIRSLFSTAAKKTGNIIIAPVVVIYVTTIVEHIAEYILNSVAMTADQADAEHIRVKEVLLALLDDPQVSILFRRMNLKEKLEKRASVYQPIYSNNYVSLPTPQPSPISIKGDPMIPRNSHTSLTTKDDIHPDISFNEYHLANHSNEQIHNGPRGTQAPSSNCSMRSSESINDRPLSIISNRTTKSSGSKSRFNFFGSKEKRNSISLNFSSSKRSTAPSSSMTSPTTPSFSTHPHHQSMSSPTNILASTDFDDLIRSGGTKKVSLTPNRLKSIEVKEESSNHRSTNDTTPWERFSNNNTKTSRTKKRSPPTPTDTTPPPPLPPLPRLNRDHHQQPTLVSPTINPSANDNDNGSPPLTPASSVASRPSQRSRHSIIYEEKSTPTTSRSSMKSSYSTSEDLLMEETTNLMSNPSKMSTSSSLYSHDSNRSSSGNNKTTTTTQPPQRIIERPSSMVVKRASMGSRPPSFHENVLMDGSNILMAAAAAGSVVLSSADEEMLRHQFESNRKSLMIKKMSHVSMSADNKDEAEVATAVVEMPEQQQQPDMIYVIPSTATIPSRSSINNTLISTRSIKNTTTTRTTMDRGCQTDPIALHTLIHQHHNHHHSEDEDEEDEQQEEEEWFIEEEEWEDHAEEEKFVAEWLLGNV